jgi:hypothetical protein
MKRSIGDGYGYESMKFINSYANDFKTYRVSGKSFTQSNIAYLRLDSIDEADFLHEWQRHAMRYSSHSVYSRMKQNRNSLSPSLSRHGLSIYSSYTIMYSHYYQPDATRESEREQIRAKKHSIAISSESLSRQTTVTYASFFFLERIGPTERSIPSALGMHRFRFVTESNRGSWFGIDWNRNFFQF